nr:hypothetical protein [Fredinandcohnia onubensis]
MLLYWLVYEVIRIIQKKVEIIQKETGEVKIIHLCIVFEEESDKSIWKEEMRMLFYRLQDKIIRKTQKKEEVIQKEIEKVTNIHLCIVFEEESDKNIRKEEMRILFYRLAG